MAKKIIAIAPLFIGTARAFNPGDEVNATPEQINEYGWGDLIANEGTKAADAVLAGGDVEVVDASPAS